MSAEETGGNGQTYRIGAVSRLTGVPADTLRVWERRYGVVTPHRTASGTRLYSAEDIGRLSLIKQLVDRGDAISRVAALSMDQLRERVSGAGLQSMQEAPARPCRVVMLGASLPQRVAGHPDLEEGLEIVGGFHELEQFRREAASLEPDVLVAEYPTIHSEQVREIAELLAQSGAAQAVVVYNFATSATLDRLDSRRIVPRRAPVDATELRRWCLMAHASAQGAIAKLDEETGINIAGPVPARRFDEASLVRVAAISTTVRCECPHHLADLIANLAAFERYSEECEIRNADDAALHTYLHAVTAHTRSLMEKALTKVLEADGIDLEAEGILSSDQERGQAAGR